MSKHSLLSPSVPSTPLKRPRFSIDGLLEASSPLSSTVPPPQKLAKIEEPSSPSCSDSDSEASSKQESENLGATSGGTLVGNWACLGDSPKLASLQCRLEGKDLWAKFFDLGTEMIITKSGRRMFPTVKVRLEGCEPDLLYYVFLDVVPVDDRRYRYVYNKSSWLTAGKAEPTPETRIYLHPDSPFPGRQLSSQVISFEKAKLTNSDVDRTGHLVLNSMHKYQPRVHVVARDRAHPLQSSRVDLASEDYKSFQFSETQFMAVTAYQNQLITKLKIEKNPFAKGFRDPSGRSTEMELERHLERLPRFPFSTIPSATAAAAALMFGQFPFALPSSGSSSVPQHPNDWIFANLAASAAAAALNNPGMPGFPKFTFPSMIPPSIPPMPSQSLIGQIPIKPTPDVDGNDDEDDDEESVDVINDKSPGPCPK